MRAIAARGMDDNSNHWRQTINIPSATPAGSGVGLIAPKSNQVKLDKGR
jgi:hypothetical protein